jgi:hypothetical protein
VIQRVITRSAASGVLLERNYLLTVTERPHAVDKVPQRLTDRWLPAAIERFPPVSTILHVRMNMQIEIRQVTDVSGCNLHNTFHAHRPRQVTHD